MIEIAVTNRNSGASANGALVMLVAAGVVACAVTFAARARAAEDPPADDGVAVEATGEQQPVVETLGAQLAEVENHLKALGREREQLK